ncbi:MAG: glycoside hydrolase family 2 [Oscillospiraceae bacterium]|nr:glycoside hydrolase family 2 [Oscillospiraceae bacterium]
MFQELFTKEGKTLQGIPWEVYPRPQMTRREWQCLNGWWDLSVLRSGKSVFEGKIQVPFCAESLLSGAGWHPEKNDVLLYRRVLSVPAPWQGKHILLHFGAVSRETKVLLNGREVCRHENGYLPFTADITGFLTGEENTLEVQVSNDLSAKYPWGKQSRKRGGMWYTPCSGIWQTVWMEPVPDRYIRALHIHTAGDTVDILADGIQSGKVLFNGKEYPLTGSSARLTVDHPEFWSPENPHLYSFSVLAGDDCVEGYFALRTLTTETVNGIPRLCLNGKPYFFNALLDQGYWSDGLYTPATPDGFEADILAMKSLGFNTLRKHIKIEPEVFYYACDRLGMVVFQDMVNNGGYHYILETVLPTLHFQKRNDRHMTRDPETRKNFLAAMEETARLLNNHPCICLWTIFNEGWGQFCADEAYSRLKAIDPGRFIDSTSGWFHQKKSDVDSLHIYFEDLHLGKKPLPQLLSEYGGYVYKIPEHSFNIEKTYGYRKYETREEFVAALRETYQNALLPLAAKGLCGAVYTQVSDVEDETNGLLTYDRAELKIRPEELRDLAQALQDSMRGL